MSLKNDLKEILSGRIPGPFRRPEGLGAYLREILEPEVVDSEGNRIIGLDQETIDMLPWS